MKTKKHKINKAREKALQVLVQLETEQSFLNSTLKKNLDVSLNREDRAFATRLSYGVVQHLNTLDWIISLQLKMKIIELTPWIRNILRISVYQFFFMDRVPTHAVVNESVKLSYRYGHKGVAGLVNAVLRKISYYQWSELPWPDQEKDPLLYLSLRYSFPCWLLRRWLNCFSFEEVEKICFSHNSIPPIIIRANTIKTTSAFLEDSLVQEGLKLKKHPVLPDALQIEQLPLPLDRLKAYRDGLFHIQGDSSQAACHALKPLEDDRILDLCASPGGKTATISQLMMGKGEIVAVEPEVKRMELLQKTIRRLQLENVCFARLDGRDISPDRWGLFQKILVDAPCSGLGVIRRKPDIKWRLQESFFKKITCLQLSLIRRGLAMLSRGGLLLYAVCSTDPEETVVLIRSALKENVNVSLVKLELTIPVKPWEGQEGLYFFQPHQHDFDGFFLAGLTRVI